MQQEHSNAEPLWTPTFIALTGINFGVALPFYLTMVIMTDFSVTTYDVSYGIGAIAVTAFIISALITRFLLGSKIDEWGAKKMLTIGLVLNLAACASYVLPMPFWLLLAMRVIQGIGFATSSSAAATAAAIVSPAARRAEGIGYFSMLQAFATGIGPFVAVFLKNITGDYLALFIFTTIVAALSLASVAILRIDDHPGLTPAAQNASKGAKTANQGIHKFLHTSVLLLTPSLFLVYLGYSGIVSFVVSFANEAGMEDAVGIYFVLYAIAILVTRPPIGKHVDKRGEHPLIYVAFASTAIGLIVLAFSWNSFVLLLSSVLLGFGIGATQSILQAVIARDIPPEELGRANSTFFMSMDLGAGVGPVLIGAFIPQIGFAGCYIALGIAAAIACVFYHLLGKKDTRKSE